MVETKWILSILNGVHNTELWNCFRKVDSTLEAHSGYKCTILFYRITYIGSSWENFLKTTALNQLSSTMSLWRRSSWEVVPSQVHTCFPFNLMCLSESLLVFCGDIATETFVTSVFRAVGLTIFTTFKFRWNKISKFKDKFYKT